MTHLDLLQYQHELRLCNIKDISDRLLELTQGDMFVAYNTLRDAYEVHSVRSFQYTGTSYNVTLDDDMVHGGTITDYRMNSNKKYAAEIDDRRQYLERLYDQAEEDRFEQFHVRGLKMIERTLGRAL